MVWSIPLGAVLLLWCTLMALAPLRRPRRVATLAWLCAAAPNEIPSSYVVLVLVATVPPLLDGAPRNPSDGVQAGLAAVTVLGLLAVAARATTARPALERALDEALGAGWRAHLEPRPPAGPRRRRTWVRSLVAPWPWRPRSVERAKDLRYGPDGRTHRLDVYRHRSRPDRAPTLVHLHGGHFRWGRKSFECRALLFHLAQQGWTCVSADYHLSPTPADGFPQHLVDVKRVIAWARTDGPRHGVDPGSIFLAGSSAGAHLTAMAALTTGDARFQPGFEEVDTSVAAGIGLYGYYGRLGGPHDAGTGPLDHLTDAAPPMLLVHGTNDTLTPVEGARSLAEGLRRSSHQPVALAELPGGQHSFDLFRSIRFEAVIDAVEGFAAWVRSGAPSRGSGPRHEGASPNAGDPTGHGRGAGSVGSAPEGWQSGRLRRS